MTAQDHLDALQLLSRQQVRLRLAIVLTPLLVLGAAAAAGTITAAVVPVSVVLAAMTALRPDSFWALVLIALLAWQWFAAVDDVRTPWVLLATASILVLHTATAAATIAPPTADLRTRMQVRWARRTVIVAVVGATTWCATVLLGETAEDGDVALASVGAAAVAGILAIVWPRSGGGDVQDDVDLLERQDSVR